MSEYYKGFLSNAVEKLANIRRGHLSPPVYERMPLPRWDMGDDKSLLFLNAKIIDVDLGKLRLETGVLLKGERIELLFGDGDLDSIREKHPVAKEIDCAGRYLMPGMSDTHCHISSTTEMISGIRDIAYLPAQREKNAEVSIRHGTTFLRDVGCAKPPKEYLIGEINAGRLVGPDVMTSYTAVIPRGGMWDFGKLKNKIAGAVIFGGDFAYFIDSVDGLKKKLRENLEGGSELIKTYQEEKPLYGFKEDTVFRMWKPEELKVIRDFADRHNQMVACHSMFIKGARIAIDTPVDTLEHMTVDSEYTLDDARKMADARRRTHMAVPGNRFRPLCQEKLRELQGGGGKGGDRDRRRPRNVFYRTAGTGTAPVPLPGILKRRGTEDGNAWQHGDLWVGRGQGLYRPGEVG